MAFEHIYRPQHKSDTEIVNDFVVRTAVFERLMADIRKDGPGKLSQHYMVHGLRGMGKSTLFERIRVEMMQPELAPRFITVKTAEENWPVNSLLDFWIWIGQHMASVDAAGFGTLGDLGSLWSKDEQHAQCFTTIEAKLKGSGRKLLMLVDNVGDLFRKFSKQENHAFREALVASKHIKLVGGTAVRLDELETHEAPYFDLFKEHDLSGLNQQEVNALLLHYARKNGNTQVEQVVRQEPHRVDHLRVLTGGVPRTIMLLLDVFNKDGDATVFEDLRRTLDLVTPLYKHRMDELSPQKQKIVHALAMQWDGMSAGEVASATRLESKVASAQLGQLVRDGFVLRDETSTKNHFYQLAERFFNIWYLMNNAQRNGPQKVRWLTRFFELWCDEQGLQDRARKHLDSIGREGLNPADLLLITNALLGSAHLDRSTKELVYERSMRSYPDHSDQLLHSSQWREQGASASGWRDAVWAAIERFELQRAERILDAEADMNDPWAMIYRGDIAVLRGALPQARKAFEDGLRIRTALAEKDPSNAQAQRDLSISYERLGDLLVREGELPQARKAFEDGLRISTALAEKDPSNAQAQRDLAWSHWQMIQVASTDETIAREHDRHYARIVDGMASHAVDAWKNGQLTEAMSRTIQLVQFPLSTTGIMEALLWALAREQSHGLRELFEVRFMHLRSVYRPVYFALLKLMQDEDPDSHRRMGKELEEPVKDILDRVNEMRKELDKPAVTVVDSTKAATRHKAASKKKRAK